MTTTDDLVGELQDLKEEELSKQVDAKVSEMIKTANEPIDLELRVDRIRSILDELDENQQTPNYVRTRLWFLTSMLESVSE